jgi:hypothetical protein
MVKAKSVEENEHDAEVQNRTKTKFIHIQN